MDFSQFSKDTLFLAFDPTEDRQKDFLHPLQQKIAKVCKNYAIEQSILNHTINFWDDPQYRWFDVEFGKGVELRGIKYTADIKYLEKIIKVMMESFK